MIRLIYSHTTRRSKGHIGTKDFWPKFLQHFSGITLFVLMGNVTTEHNHLSLGKRQPQLQRQPGERECCDTKADGGICCWVGGGKTQEGELQE